MSYLMPTADENRYLIKAHWRQHDDPSKRARACDKAFLDAKVRATHRRLETLLRTGLKPHDAEIRAMREVAFAD